MAGAKWKTAALAVGIAGAGILTLAVVGGFLFEQTQRSRDRERYPQVGRSIDIGGRTLNIDCEGTGEPPVILESGANWPVSPAVFDPKTMWSNGGPRPGYSWISIQRSLAALTRVCWYDRAGSGWSDLGPYPRDSVSQARDLHALLRGAQIAPPYVLVGESSAALDVRVYADAYPSDVAGLVLVNWADPGIFLNVRGGKSNRAKRIPEVVYHSQDAMGQFFHWAGMFRLGSAPPAPPPPHGLTAGEWNTIWFLTFSAKARGALIQDIASWRMSSAEAHQVGSFGARPLIVLRAENLAAPPEFLEAWTNAQTKLARASTRGRQISAGGSARDLLYDAPEAIAGAVRQAVAEVRGLRPGDSR